MKRYLSATTAAMLQCHVYITEGIDISNDPRSRDAIEMLQHFKNDFNIRLGSWFSFMENGMLLFSSLMPLAKLCSSRTSARGELCLAEISALIVEGIQQSLLNEINELIELQAKLNNTHFRTSLAMLSSISSSSDITNASSIKSVYPMWSYLRTKLKRCLVCIGDLLVIVLQDIVENYFESGDQGVHIICRMITILQTAAEFFPPQYLVLQQCKMDSESRLLYDSSIIPVKLIFHSSNEDSWNEQDAEMLHDFR